MNIQDAKRLLDTIKEGASYPTEVVDKALDMSGDQRDYIYLPSPEIDEFVHALRESGQL
jgi:hypothetical protein